MKIILTSTLKQLQPLDIYNNNTGDELVLWHQDTLNSKLLEQLIETHGRPGVLISSAHPEYDIDEVSYYYWPDDLCQLAYQIDALADINDYPTEYCFNFMINKNQTNRFLLIKLVEWFKLTSYDYTWSGANSFDCSEILTELELLDNDLRYHIMKPGFDLPSKFIELPDGVTQNNLAVWNHALGNIFSKSAVSLITESIGAEKIINFTEKSLFSVQALTFPIWIGGYRQADHWANHGFDVFDEVVDHSYQHCDTLIERCTRAFRDNLQLLTDLEYAASIRTQYMDRLLHNRSNLKFNLDQTFVTQWNRIPKQLQTAIVAMMKTWHPHARNTNSFKLLNLN